MPAQGLAKIIGASSLAKATLARILANVAQITLYVPDNVARKLKADARKAKKSLSAYIADLAAGRRERRAFPKWFFELAGSSEGTLDVPEDPPPDEIESL